MSDASTTFTPERLLIGRLAEYEELVGVLDSRQGLTIVAADPWSGTSAVVRSAIEEIAWPCVLVDARPCTDELDLAMAIADATVSSLAPEAAGWWQRLAPPASKAGLELSRVLSTESIDLEDLQLGAGRAEERLDDAIRLLVALAAPQPATLIIDHAGLLLAGMPAPDSRKLLGKLRSLRQTHQVLDLLLVEHPDGEASTALQDADHPLYRAGRQLRLRRPDPARYVDDLAIARPSTDVTIALLRIAADLAAGVPWLTWQIVDHGSSSNDDPRAQALAGWAAIRTATDPATVREWDLLRRLHPQAQTVFAALASGLKPHSIAANSKSVSDALRRLNGAGLAWQPQPRRWVTGNPLLASWAHEHPPPWIHRRRGAP